MVEDAFVLVVDDDTDACNVLQEMLSSLGIRGHSTSNPLQVIDLVTSNFYNVILLDINMPEQSGMDLLPEIVEVSPDTKIIIISGFGDKKSVIKALRLGAFDFLEKPLDYKLISHSIQRALHTQKVQLAYRDEKMKLRDVNRQLVETNQALSTLAKNIERTRKDTEATIEEKIRVSILPIIDKLQQGKELSHSVQHDLKLLTNLLADLTSNLDGKQELPTSLTSTELRIALLIRNRLTSDEIAKHICISPETVKSHRKNIRKKLGLDNSNQNLGAYLKAELDQ
jgi:FixJ family two-component response regulator